MVPAITNIRPVPDIAVLKDIPTTMMVNATSVPRGISSMPRVPVTAVQRDMPTTMMVNATSVPRGISSMTRVEDIAVLKDIPIIMMANAGTSLVVQRYKPPTTQAAASAREIIPLFHIVEVHTRPAMPITRDV